MTEEVWRPIPGRDGYEASSLGRVRSLDRTVTFDFMGGRKARRFPGKISKQWSMRTRCGNVYWLCSIEGRGHMVNRAVCAAFHGAPPSKAHEAAHLDGNSERNLPENLAWATHVENEGHKFQHGTDPTGERNGQAMLKAEDVPVIFSEYLKSDAPGVAIKFGVDRGCIYAVLKRKTWKSVPIDPSILAACKIRAVQNRAAQLKLRRRA